MGKGNAYLTKLQAERRIAVRNARWFTLQQCKDMLLIAANDEFGFGEERLRRLSDAFDRTFTEYAEMVLEDADSDGTVEYSRAKIDERLKAICGANFVPWEERYR